MTRVRRAATAAALLLGLAACAAGTRPAPRASDRLDGGQVRLAELARLAAAAVYDATYELVAATGERGTIRIVAAPPSYRVDVAVGSAAPTTFIQRGGSVVSCTSPIAGPSCLLVARPGEAVPELFDPGVQRLFSDAVADLAAHPERFVVESRAAPRSPAGAECFDVRRIGSTPTASATGAAAADPSGFETGQYCFGADGVLTRLSVSTGTLTLLARGPAPTSAAFHPPATPIALPDLPSSAPSPPPT